MKKPTIKICDKCGGPIFNLEHAKKIYDAYQKTKSFAKVGRMLNLNRSTVWRTYHRYLNKTSQNKADQK